MHWLIARCIKHCLSIFIDLGNAEKYGKNYSWNPKNFMAGLHAFSIQAFYQIV